eukprot:TRINITY_DN390_c0_g1_i1.p1 TRINITY_DN390_c0_g1~~TRINITY_DN390_c0_g1_i1.p1  ORF type:complete len:390 (+),score=64.40 TRINITY_DN390_c0_g1_i1:118-1287(+)
MAAQDDLSQLKTMRDVFDYCQRNNLHSVAQGMIELPPPRKLRQICAEGLLNESETDFHQYRARFGEPEYLEAIRTLLKRHYKVDAPEGSVLGVSGVTGGIVAALVMLKAMGASKVGLIEPFYTYHARQVQEVLGQPPSAIPSNDDWSPNWEAVEASIKQGTNCIMMCNPTNPTGRVWSADEIRRLVRLCEENNVYFLLDEIYCDMVFEGSTHFSPINDELSEKVIVCRGFSKTLGTQSWRLAYIVSHPNTIVSLMAHHDPIYISLSWQQHYLARYLTDEYEDFVQHISTINELLRTNWKILYPVFQEVLGWQPIEPSGSMYGMFKHGLESDFQALQEGLKVGVGVAPGAMFYAGDKANTGYIRIHVGISEQKARAIAQTMRQKHADRKK